jgi:hypothetical protein
MTEFMVQEWSDGKWRIRSALPFMTQAAEDMISLDGSRAPALPRRIIDGDGKTILSGRHCARDTPVNDIKIFSIVMSLDKPGPRERDGGPYFQHASRADAIAEARRMSQAAHGGRFGVLELVHVVGWIDVDLEAEIPF